MDSQNVHIIRRPLYDRCFHKCCTLLLIPFCSIRGASGFDSCHRFNYTGTDQDSSKCSADHFDRTTIVGCSSQFVYDKSEFLSTLTTELDLVCKKEPLRRLLGMKTYKCSFFLVQKVLIQKFHAKPVTGFLNQDFIF